MERALTQHPSQPIRAKISREAGFTLIEVSIAMLILLIGVTSMLGAIALGVGVNKAQGEVASRVTTYAQTKLEELMSIEYADTVTDTTVFPSSPTGGTGLSAGGSIAPGAAATGYVDYLTEDGARTTAADASFRRQWAITDNASGNSKTVEVAVYSRRVATQGTAPTTVLVGIKANH